MEVTLVIHQQTQMTDLTNVLDDLMCEDNCRLITDTDHDGTGDVISLRDNDDSAITDDTTADATDNGADNSDDPTTWSTEGASAASIADNNLLGEVPITITEQGPNSGVFGSFDESDNSNIVIVEGAARGTSASIDYNEDPITVLVGVSFGSIDIQPTDDEWNSGEEIPIELVDADANKNSRADEDLDLNNPEVTLIPSLRTGDPATLDSTGLTVALDSVNFSTIPVDRFSDILRAEAPAGLTTIADGDTLDITFGTMEDFFDAVPVNDNDFRGFALFNYDFRSLENDGNLSITSITIDFPQATGFTAVTTNDLQGLIIIDDVSDGSSTFGSLSDATSLDVEVTLNTPTRYHCRRHSITYGS